MSEQSELNAQIEALEKRVKYLEDTFATLADMNKSGEMGQYIAQRQRALAASKLVNTAAGSQKLNADAQQQIIDQMAAEKSAVDARIEEAIRVSEQNALAEDDLAEQFTYRDVPGGVEIQGFNGFEVGEELIIPDKIEGKSVVSIGECAFRGMKFIKIRLPEYLEIIQINAFRDCDELIEVFIPDNVIRIRCGAFADCKKLRSIKLPDRLKYIEIAAFRRTAIKQISIPQSVDRLPRSCFGGCESLEKVILNDGLQWIDPGCFIYTNITKLVVPASVQKIRYGFSYENEAIDKPISIAVLGKETQMEGIQNNMTIYCLPGSKIQQEAKSCGVKVRPLSEFEYDEENNYNFQSDLKKCLTAGCEEPK